MLVTWCTEIIMSQPLFKSNFILRRSGVAIFADIIKFVTMFIKKIFKDSGKVFLDLAKFAEFRWKNADVSRTQGVCHLIHIFFGSSLGKYNCSKFNHWRICVTDFKEAAFLASSYPWAAPKKPILNRDELWTKNKNAPFGVF